MKKFFSKISLLFLPFILAFIAIAIIDPYNVFHYKTVRDNGIEPNKHYIKMRYILNNPDKFDSFLFGSSRVGFINVAAIPSLYCYNMTYSQGIPKEHLDDLKTMLQKGIIPNTVLIGIDDIACYVEPETHHGELLRIPPPSIQVNIYQEQLAHSKFLKEYLHVSLFKSVPIIISHKGNNAEYRKQFYENGGYKNRDGQAAYDWENATVYSTPFYYGIDSAIADIQSILDLCRKYGIKLILFTNPIHRLTYRQAVKNGYIDFLMRLSNITDFYNFSGINDITTNNDNYHETSHYKHVIGYLIIDAIFYNKIDGKLLSQGFGYYVTNESKADFYNIMKKQQESQNTE